MALQSKMTEMESIMVKALEAVPQSAEKNTATEGGEVKYSYKGVNKDGIEVYGISKDTLKLSWKERKAKYLDFMKNKYAGRTAKFIRNGHAYYAVFDRDSLRKPIYGDNRLSRKGKDALVNAGADGDVFNLVERSSYSRSAKNTKTNTNADYFGYFVKTVQIDNMVFDLVADVEKHYGERGGYVYTLALVDNETIKASPALGSPEMGPVKTQGNASDYIVAQTPNAVNSENEDKKRTLKWFHDCGNLNVPLAGTQFGVIHSIAYDGSDVNTAVDSQFDGGKASLKAQDGDFSEAAKAAVNSERSGELP